MFLFIIRLPLIAAVISPTISVLFIGYIHMKIDHPSEQEEHFGMRQYVASARFSKWARGREFEGFVGLFPMRNCIGKWIGIRRN